VNRVNNLACSLCVVFFLAIPGATAQLICSPAPCVTENVQVSPADPNITAAGMVLAASPVSGSQDLAITSNYLVNMSDCHGSAGNSSSSAVFLSVDLGSVWSGGCQSPSGSDVGPQYDPIAIYDQAGNLFSGQLGDSSRAENVFLQVLPTGSNSWGNFFPTLSYTDQATEDFFDFDFPGMAIDSNLTTPCIYITAWELGLSLGASSSTVSAVVVGHSCDGGSAWTTHRVSSILSAPSFAVYPRIAVSQNHTVVAMWVQLGNSSTAQIYESSSDDFGSIWSTPARVLTLNMTRPANCENNPHVNRALPNTCVRVFYFPQVARTHFSSTATTQTEAVFPSYKSPNIAINYSASSNGTTWSKPIVLSRVAADQFEPCIAANPANTEMIGVAWLDTRNSAPGLPDTLYDAYGITSADGGSTWSAAYRLSSSSGGTKVETAPNSQYLGDWTGCAWQNNIFYFAYPSTANGINQLATIVGLNP
jgi:hypothetical protein